MTNRIAPKSPGLTSLPKLGPAILEDRQSLRALSREDFARLPRPKNGHFAPDMLVVFTEKYTTSRNALTPAEQTMLKNVATLILKEGSDSLNDDLRNSLQKLSKSARVADKAFFAELTAKTPQLEPAPKGWTAKPRTAPATRETRTEAPQWPMPGSAPKKYDYPSVEAAIEAGAQWSLMDKSYMLNGKSVSVAPKAAHDDGLKFEYYDSKDARWKMAPRSVLERFD